jgi:hypothetical protein
MYSILEHSVRELDLISPEIIIRHAIGHVEALMRIITERDPVKFPKSDPAQRGG